MVTVAIRFQIINFVDKAPVDIQEQYQNGVFLGWVIRSLVDEELPHIAWNHSNLELGIINLKKIFAEKLEKDFLANKPLPFKLN